MDVTNFSTNHHVRSHLQNYMHPHQPRGLAELMLHQCQHGVCVI